jgi:hypothetical protein
LPREGPTAREHFVGLNGCRKSIHQEKEAHETWNSARLGAIHPHDGHVRRTLAGGAQRRRSGFACRADRDEYAPRHAANPEAIDFGFQPSLSTDVEGT